MKSLTAMSCLKIQNFQPYLHVTFPDHYLCCVGVLDQLLQSLRVDVVQGDMGLSTLWHLICMTTKNQGCYIFFSEPSASPQSCWHMESLQHPVLLPNDSRAYFSVYLISCCEGFLKFQNLFYTTCFFLQYFVRRFNMDNQMFHLLNH